ncbi:MAG: hypothetical protein ACFFCS_25400, partial [Candidatus Hodarchaeota archaeon]
ILAIISPLTQSRAFRASMGITVVTAIYILIFQIRLVLGSMGSIKSRLKLFITGEVICLFGLISAAELIMDMLVTIIPENLKDFTILIGVGTLIIGFTIIFISGYNFPENAFYEVEWKRSLLKLFIVDVNTNKSLYNCTFSDITSESGEEKKGIGKVNQEDITSGDALFSGGIVGIESLVSEISKAEAQKTNKIDRGNSFILLEYGSESFLPVLYALVVNKDLDSLAFFLKNVRVQFESFYNRILQNLDKIPTKREQLFSSFDMILKNIL